MSSRNLTAPPAAPRAFAAGLREFVRFVAVGILNTAFGYAVFAAAVLAGAGSAASLVLAYLLGVPFNFVTTGRLVFRVARRASFLRFVAAYVVIYGFNAVVYRALLALGLTPLVAQAVCLVPVALFGFAIFKLHVFGVAPPGPGGDRTSVAGEAGKEG